MTRKAKLKVVMVVTIVLVAVVYYLPPIPQSLQYHHFADTRLIWGIPNFGNVVSNLPFLWTGGLGLCFLVRFRGSVWVRAVYGVLFLAIVCIAVGSGYYHLHPDNERLLLDRLPMTVVFMALLTATVMEFISLRLGQTVFLPLVFIGAFSVCWWSYTEHMGRGDLRLYGLVQFYPMVCIPLVIWLFYRPTFQSPVHALINVVVWYAVAKMFETFDGPIYEWLGVSGHTLKHLAASMSTYYLVQFFRRRYFPRT